MVDSGDFQGAEARIAAALASGATDHATRQALLFERERMRRILLDFTLDDAAAREQLRRYIPDLRADEFQRWTAGGQLEHREIDGQRRYFKRSVPNLFRLSDEAAARRAEPRPFSEGPMESLHPHHAEVVDAARASGSTSVLPRRVRVRQALSVDADAVPAGEVLRAWIPFPREIEGQQEAVTLLASTPAQAVVAPAGTGQRTAYMEQPARAGEPTRFSVEYELTLYARYFPIDPDAVVPAPASDELAPFLAEQPPHIVFTPELRAFSRQVVGSETRPYRIASKLFEAVDRIPWAGAREYSTISNISAHALHTGHADCGQQTLLLMTLLRMNGIPARWQSGMVYSDGAGGDGEYWNLHDWGWLYLAPYGWVPMDVTTGRLASDEEALEWFYLGGLDAYRIVFNDDQGTPLYPHKQFFRSDTVDSQRGEVEWSGGNLYYDQWDYDFDARLLPATSD
ncbi:transglutaminase domain-containing protein [Lysobacter sp. GX 14042]|uniref:transglutaminase-like domain-containing protein n=1 Tax=Lysobacter sp. GX 14042 TaxID=2907155 RepID=UPI001F3A0ED5|nr:transglutaminase-like domain-containing protein [Lysobacter sp. GX 14042]MCE7031328.1 transglutaminase domain-containing protein [Lysobacter sp. GX 14042]